MKLLRPEEIAQILRAEENPEPKALDAFKRRMMTLSVDDISDVTKLSRQTITRMITEGALPAILVRVGKPGVNGRKGKHVWRVRAVAFERWLLAREKGV